MSEKKVLCARFSPCIEQPLQVETGSYQIHSFTFQQLSDAIVTEIWSRSLKVVFTGKAQ